MSRLLIYRLPVIDELQAEAERRGLALRAVARELHVTPTTVANWYRGITAPTLDAPLQRRMAAFLGRSPSDVLRLFDLDLGEELQRPANGGDHPADPATDQPGDGGQ